MIIIQGSYTINSQERISNTITCQKCGNKQNQAAECHNCGVIFRKISEKNPPQTITENQSKDYEPDSFKKNFVKKAPVFAFFILVILFLSQTLTNHTSSIPTPNKTANISTPIKEVLPAGYESLDNIINLYQELSSIKKKGEFETTAEYYGRIDKHSGKVYSFKRHPENKDIQYDADKQSLSIKIANSQKKTLLELSSYDNSNYTGSNAFGVSANVEKSLFKYYGLSFPYFDERMFRGNYCFISKKNEYDNTYAIIQITSEDAKTIKGNIKLIYKIVTYPVERPSATGHSKDEIYTETEYLHIKPTIDDPSDLTRVIHYVKSSLIEIVIYNQLTGDILASIKV
ncbi:MAG: hypothetical protein ACD_5C00054G0002 [uncultured bacterium]|nr:MAG: hypothetical protein ACD_5C00054G0002 [uncultured bacterium]